MVVPDAFFKDGSRYQGVAFVMGNDNSRYWLDQVAMPVDELEKLTGIDFYPALPDDMEDVVEAGYDPAVWSLRTDR